MAATKTINELQYAYEMAIIWWNDATRNWHAVDQVAAVAKAKARYEVAKAELWTALGDPTPEQMYRMKFGCDPAPPDTDEYRAEVAREDRMHRGMERFGGTFTG
jgi:hypothetical protein